MQKKAIDKKDREKSKKSPITGYGGATDSALGNLPIAIIRLKASGKILFANDAAHAIFDGRLKINKPLSDYVEGLGRPVEDWLTEAITKPIKKRSEILRLSNKDTDRFLQITLSVASQKPEPEIIAVVTDATELRGLQTQFVQAQKMQAIGLLAGGIAHDFNNILTAIIGHADLILEDQNKHDKHYNDVVQIHKNAHRAAGLVSQLLAFSRKQTLRPKPVDLRAALPELSQFLNRVVGEKIQIRQKNDPWLRLVRVDLRQLEQVIMNLVVNARDAMEDGGEVVIATKNIILEKELIQGQVRLEPGTYVRIKVCDSGTGIKPEIIDKIFDPFFSTKKDNEGTGLGLSTVYGIVKQSGGYVFAKNCKNGGSAFSIYLPALDPGTKLEDIVFSETPQETIGAKSILLVEDEDPVRTLVARALRKKGYNVIEANLGKDALKLLDDPDVLVDLFISDVIMPGLDGPEWIEKALIKRPNVKVFFISGYARETFAAKLKNLSDAEFLQKPFSLTNLLQIVEKIVPN